MVMIARDVPAEHSEDKVHDEERSDDDEADKVDPRPCNSHCIVNLPTENQPHAAYSHTEVSSVNWDLLETHNQDKDLSPVSTTRVDGPSSRVTGFHYPSTRLVETRARQHGPS